jgi:ABC-type Fe3+ transport system permease subunit
MSTEPEMPRRWDVIATTATIVAWVALIALIGVALAQPEGTSDEGCLDICIAPPAWFVLFVLLTPVVILGGLVGIGAGSAARRQNPAGLGHTMWLSSVAALVVLVLSWIVMYATGPH